MKKRPTYLQAAKGGVVFTLGLTKAKALLAHLGVDRTVMYLVGGRLWSVLSGLITMVLVLQLVSREEQGFYYTFTSLIGMQVLLELGMGVVVLQYASHEMAGLQWQGNGTLVGNELQKTRLKSLLVLVLKWYGAVFVAMILLALPLGWYFFSRHHPGSTVDWQGAWFLLVPVSAINIFSIPLFAIFEGLGDIRGVAKARFQQNLVGSLFAWAVLFADGGLMALPALSAGYAAVFVGWLVVVHRRVFTDLLAHLPAGQTGIDWRTEIWPFQWKIGLSWVSGYFMFQLFTPVLFASRGAVEAGQMGLSLAIANAMTGIAATGIAAKSPMFGMLVARKDYSQLDSLFDVTLMRSVGVFMAGAFILAAIRFGLHYVAPSYENRLLSPFAFSLLMLATLLSFITFAQATYLRAHKEDPFLVIGLISAVLISAWTLWSAPAYGALGVMAGYAFVCAVVGGAWGTVIFSRKRREWRSLAAHIDGGSVA